MKFNLVALRQGFFRMFDQNIVQKNIRWNRSLTTSFSSFDKMVLSTNPI
jgi:hypothetical protein